jgi:transcriptional regulator of stress and heat shock response
MARISDHIESILKQMMDQNNGMVEFARNSLAGRVNCVPSQITYVLATRFTNDQGFLVESRRGGGGWIRIRRVEMASPTAYLMHALNAIGDRLSQHQAEILIRNFLDYEVVKDRDARLLLAATSDRCLAEVDIGQKDSIRMLILKNMLISLIVR